MIEMVCAALLIGIVAGLRAFTAPAAMSWGAASGILGLGAVHGWPAFMAISYVPWIFTVLALGELVTDQLPSTPSRKVPMQFGARLVMGGLAGATVGAAGASIYAGLVAGVVGAVIGTLGGAESRGKLAAAFGSDRPAAFLEDAVAIGLGVLVVIW